MKHYSASQINQFLRCPQQWLYKKTVGPIPPSSALVQGTSYHKALEFNFSQKIESHEDKPLEEVTDAYATAFESGISGVEWTPEELGIGPDKVRSDLKDQGIALVQVAHAELAPKIQPCEVEKPFTIGFENADYTIEGRIDLVDNRGVIHDHKTTSKSPTKKENGNYTIGTTEIIQGGLYCLSEHSNSLVFDYAIKKKKPEIIQIPWQIGENDQEFVLRMVASVDNAIRREVFYPNRTAMMCSKRYCGWWKNCLQEWKGEIKE